MTGVQTVLFRSGTNKDYIDFHIPHLSKLMVNDINHLVDNAEVIVVNNNENEYVETLLNTNSLAVVVDMVRLPYLIRERKNYYGINW